MDKVGIRRDVAWLQEDLHAKAFPDKARDAIRRIAAWSSDYASYGHATSRWYALVASDQLLRLVMEGSLLPASRVTACRALRLADLVRESA